MDFWGIFIIFSEIVIFGYSPYSIIVVSFSFLYKNFNLYYYYLREISWIEPFKRLTWFAAAKEIFISAKNLVYVMFSNVSPLLNEYMIVFVIAKCIHSCLQGDILYISESALTVNPLSFKLEDPGDLIVEYDFDSSGWNVVECCNDSLKGTNTGLTSPDGAEFIITFLIIISAAAIILG
jgi:hypothetical protein